MIAAAKSLPRLGGALATVAATRLTALRALRFKYSKLVEPNFAVLFASTSPPQLAPSQTAGTAAPVLASRCVGSSFSVSCAPFFVIGQTIIGVIERWPVLNLPRSKRGLSSKTDLPGSRLLRATPVAGPMVCFPLRGGLLIEFVKRASSRSRLVIGECPSAGFHRLQLQIAGPNSVRGILSKTLLFAKTHFASRVDLESCRAE